MTSQSKLSDRSDSLQTAPTDADLDCFAEVANKLADASGHVIRKYFRKKFEILHKDDLSMFLYV